MAVRYDSINSRIANYEPLFEQFDNNKLCFSVDDDLGIFARDPQNNIIYHNQNIKLIGSGTFNNVYLVVDRNCEFIIRLQKTSTKFNMDAFAESCISDIYSLFFSKLVKDDIFPHFPIVINSFICNDDYVTQPSLTIQEYVENDFLKLLNSSTDIRIIKKMLVQIILTLFFMNKTLNIAHNDIKPANVLVKNIQSINLTYKYGDVYFNIPSNEHLALITDFDKSRSNTKKYDTDYILEYYANDSIEKYPSRRDFIEKMLKKIQKMSFDSSGRMFFSDIFLLAVTTSWQDPTMLNVAYDFIILNKRLSECCKTHFSDVCNITDSLPINHKLYNFDIKIDNTYITKYKSLYLCAFNDNEFKYNRGDDIFSQYINSIYKLNRFESINVTREKIQELINTNVPIRSTHINNSQRKALYSWLKKFAIENTSLSNAYKLMNYLLEHNENINEKNFRAYCLICFYIFSNEDLYSLWSIFNTESPHKYTEIELMHIFNDIFDFLENFEQ